MALSREQQNILNLASYEAAIAADRILESMAHVNRKGLRSERTQNAEIAVQRALEELEKALIARIEQP